MAKGKYEEWLTEEKLTLLSGWARDGLTDEQIAHNMGISRSTLNEWKKKYSDISDTLKRGKDVIDYEVENSLLKRALGYRTTEIVRVRDKSGKLKSIREIERDIIPDTTAQIFWLKNRRPDRWRNNPEGVEDNEFEDDGLLAALDAQTMDMEDDSWMLEEESDEQS